MSTTIHRKYSGSLRCLAGHNEGSDEYKQLKTEGKSFIFSVRRNVMLNLPITYHKYTPRSSTCVVTRKSAIGDMAKLVTGDSTKKQSISLDKKQRYKSVQRGGLFRRTHLFTFIYERHCESEVSKPRMPSSGS